MNYKTNLKICFTLRLKNDECQLFHDLHNS